MVYRFQARWVYNFPGIEDTGIVEMLPTLTVVRDFGEPVTGSGVEDDVDVRLFVDAPHIFFPLGLFPHSFLNLTDGCFLSSGVDIADVGGLYVVQCWQEKVCCSGCKIREYRRGGAFYFSKRLCSAGKDSFSATTSIMD